MSTHRKEWDCCGDVTETDSWEPEACPFCTPAPQLVGYIYESISGVFVFHKVGALNEKLLAADVDAARQWPKAHSVTPVYAIPQLARPVHDLDEKNERTT